jgi:hypothetical protein
MAEVDACLAACATKYGAVFENKADSALMQKVGDVFGLLRPLGVNVPSNDEWPHYATTIGNVVFMPDDGELTAWSKLRMGLHEVTHVVQQGSGAVARLTWSARYLRFQEFRAAQEAGAYTADAELYFMLTGQLPPVEEIVRIDHGYALAPEQVTFGRLLGEQERQAMAFKLYGQPTALFALHWFEAEGLLAA